MNIGVFGGSFDPVHLGHLRLAEAATRQANLDRLIFLPAAQQPLKPCGPHATEAQRLEMIHLALQSITTSPNLYVVSSLELERGGVSYTADTLAELKRQQPEAAIYFLMGADALAELPQWHRPEKILTLATPLVVQRPGCPPADDRHLRTLIPADQGDSFQVRRVQMPPTDISSSEIRRRIAQGETWADMVPATVAQYISEHRLYGAEPREHLR